MGLNENFAKIRGQILNLKHPGLTDIYNILDQNKSQHIVESSTIHIFFNPATFQAKPLLLLNSHMFCYIKGAIRSHFFFFHKMGHVADKCYNLHGFSHGFTSKLKKPQNIGSINIAATQLPL